MGGYFNIIGIPPTSTGSVLYGFDSIQDKDGDEISLFKCAGGSTVAFADTVLKDAEGIAKVLSARVPAPVILLSYADDVVWGYNLFESGEEVDRYSSRPNYWQELTEEEYARQAGDAARVASVWPDLSADAIAGYLTDKEKVPEDQTSQKAYPDDEHEAWDGWQLTDFMKKLGLSFPFDDEGGLAVEHLSSLSIATKKGRASKRKEEALSRDFDKVREYCEKHGKDIAKVWPYYREHRRIPGR